jgi:hypothetical protein
MDARRLRYLDDDDATRDLFGAWIGGEIQQAQILSPFGLFV